MNIFSRITSGRGMIRTAVVVVILALTLWPSGNSPPPPFSFDFVFERRWLADGILNICLFVPLGLAIGWNSRSPVKAILAGILLSTAVELAQTIVPGRDPSLSDIIFNTVGAVGGALIGRGPYAWLLPDARNSAILTTLSILAAALLMTATALLLSPVQSSSREKPPISVSRVGDDLLLRYPSRASALGLDEPEYWAHSAFRMSSTDDKVPLSLWRERARWHIAIGAGNEVTFGPTVGQGWTLLAYPDAIARRWGALVSGIWLWVLCVPIGFWARGRIRLIAAMTLMALLVLIPWLTGIVATSSIEWVGAAFGFFAGSLLASLGRRNSTIQRRSSRPNSAPPVARAT